MGLIWGRIRKKLDLFLNGEENAKEKRLNRMKGGKDGTKNFVRENDQEKLGRI